MPGSDLTDCPRTVRELSVRPCPTDVNRETDRSVRSEPAINGATGQSQADMSCLRVDERLWWSYHIVDIVDVRLSDILWFYMDVLGRP